MPGDGISLQTTLAQLGTVAKAQARGQQAPAPTTQFSEVKDQQDELKVQQVKEATESEKGRIQPDDDPRDKRRKRRLRRRRMKDNRNDTAAGSAPATAEDTDDDLTTVGSMLDLRV